MASINQPESTESDRLVRFGSVSVRSVKTSRPIVLSASGSTEPSLLMCIVSRGKLMISSAALSPITRLEAGMSVLLDSSKPARLVPSSETVVQIVSVPPEILPPSIPRTKEWSFSATSAPLTRPVSSFLEAVTLLHEDARSPLSDYYIERLVQEMVLGVIVDASRSIASRRAPDTFLVALAVIVARREDLDLSPALIAQSLSISLRQLQRAFKTRGTTIERAIRRERLLLAIDLLRDPHFRRLSVSDVARRAGFSSSSSLARALADDGHPSPSRIRAAESTPDDVSDT